MGRNGTRKNSYSASVVILVLRPFILTVMFTVPYLTFPYTPLSLKLKKGIAPCRLYTTRISYAMQTSQHGRRLRDGSWRCRRRTKVCSVGMVACSSLLNAFIVYSTFWPIPKVCIDMSRLSTQSSNNISTEKCITRWVCLFATYLNYVPLKPSSRLWRSIHQASPLHPFNTSRRTSCRTLPYLCKPIHRATRVPSTRTWPNRSRTRCPWVVRWWMDLERVV